MKANQPDRSGKNNPNYGKVSALRGRKIEDFRSADSVAKTKERLSMGIHSGHKHSIETKNKIGAAISGEKNGFFNRKHTEETKEIIRQKTLLQFSQGNAATSNNKPEKRFEKYLKELNIQYKKQVPLAFWVFDFYLPMHDAYIECDGDYWHANPIIYSGKQLTKAQRINLSNDKSKNTYTRNRGIKLIRFWESDILSNKEYVIGVLTALKETQKLTA